MTIFVYPDLTYRRELDIVTMETDLEDYRIYCADNDDNRQR